MNVVVSIFVAAIVVGGLAIALSITGLDPFRELIAFYNRS